ncbi:UNVERIFIED_CONTAM: hypothetical protein Scaly_2634500 [Sesamum calycinum]|uniref:Reverse transcriptase n=1 Tax=Sesamum calycinum TaxID=2727403 RepID=A0AAW2JDA0_9LAMI
MHEITRILSTFEAASRLKINLEKSILMFSHNTPAALREELANLFGVVVKEKPNKYLGLPWTVGRLKREVFEGLKDNFWQKINGWATKKLSQLGRAVLIKSILQAVPSYVMTCFEIQEGIVKELECMMAIFSYKVEENKNFIGLCGINIVAARKKVD